MMIRVAIVEDHPVMADGLRIGLEQADDIQVAWTAAGVAEARASLDDPGRSVDVVLIDVRLPDGRGFELLSGQRAERPAFIIVSSFDRPLYAVTAFRAGAAGFVSKIAPIEDVLAAVRLVASGGLAFEAKALDSVRDGPSFSPRELEVIRLVSASLSNDEIAQRLGISHKTVEAYLHEIYSRQGLASRTELALWAEREGWLEVP
jgi:DNA-binding NarL/FixJ family response regulator